MADNDVFAALTGGAPTDAARQAALADALRRQSQLGQLYAMSGDRVLAPQGEAMQHAALSGGQDIATERKAQIAQALEQQHYAQAQAQEQASLAERKREADMTDARQREMQKLLLQNRLDVQDEKNAAKGAGGEKLPATTIKELEEYRDSAQDINDAANSYQNGFGGFGRNMENFLAQKGFGTQSQKVAQNWWANYGRQFTLDEMHRRFGARLTPQEMARFEQFHIDPNMSDAQIKMNLQQLQQQFGGLLERRVNDLKAGGYNPGFLDSIMAGRKGTTAAPNPGDKYLPQPNASGGPAAQGAATQVPPMQRAPQAAPQAAGVMGQVPANLLQQALATRMLAPQQGNMLSGPGY